MPIATQKIVPCLWFDTQAEDAAKFYCSIFDNSRITYVSHYGEEGHEVHRKPAGTVMVVQFELGGEQFIAMNGGPEFTFDEAVSFQIHCADQKEVDYYWERLTSDGGKEVACGWLKDKFGLSWQVVPTVLYEMLTGEDHAASQRVMKAFMQMTKYDIAALERAYEGVEA
jgi:predicted 3-demethylubiquinone-9 3-methyltransferase (glyoxalase superfamily)